MNTCNRLKRLYTTMSHSIITFDSKIRSFLYEIRTDPLVLRKNKNAHQELQELEKRIHKKTKNKKEEDEEDMYAAQGTGNKVTDQELCFAKLLENYEFEYTDTIPTKDGLYYIYQVNGTQKSIDFEAFITLNGEKQKAIQFDLKNTTKSVFFLNDGWFHEDVVYVVSWVKKIAIEGQKRKKEDKPETFIGFGQHIPSEEETALYNEMCELKKKYNTDNKGIGNLQIYLRSANRYKCDKFTEEFTEECFKAVISSVTPSAPPSPKQIKRPKLHSSSSSSDTESVISDITCGESSKVTDGKVLTTE
jgi:hypothetical protein